MPIPKVQRGRLIDADEQNALIDQVNANTDAIAAGSGAALTTHIEDSTPHPAYDDLPSLKLLFENGLV